MDNEDLNHLYQERAGIYQHDGGHPRKTDERLARIFVMKIKNKIEKEIEKGG